MPVSPLIKWCQVSQPAGLIIDRDCCQGPGHASSQDNLVIVRDSAYMPVRVHIRYVEYANSNSFFSALLLTLSDIWVWNSPPLSHPPWPAQMLSRVFCLLWYGPLKLWPRKYDQILFLWGCVTCSRIHFPTWYTRCNLCPIHHKPSYRPGFDQKEGQASQGGNSQC